MKTSCVVPVAIAAAAGALHGVRRASQGAYVELELRLAENSDRARVELARLRRVFEGGHGQSLRAQSEPVRVSARPSAGGETVLLHVARRDSARVRRLVTLASGGTLLAVPAAG